MRQPTCDWCEADNVPATVTRDGDPYCAAHAAHWGIVPVGPVSYRAVGYVHTGFEAGAL